MSEWVILSRQSPLATWQARSLQSALRDRLSIDSIIQGVTTEGDERRDQPLYELGGKSLFIKAIEEALLRGEGRLGIHSLKDMAALDAHGLVTLPFGAREDARDALVAREPLSTWSDLPKGARVGTSSLRRAAILKAQRPDLRITSIRGNVGTRLRHVEEGALDAIVLAAAGLHRLGYQDRISTYLPIDVMLPAACQGILAIQCHPEDADRLQALVDPVVSAQASAERAVCAALGASCQTPIGVHAEVAGDRMHLQALVLGVDGQQRCEAEAEGPMASHQDLAVTVCEALKTKGVHRLLP